VHRSLALAGIFLTLLIATPTHARAQASAHSGPFVGLGVGYGSFGCQTCGTRNSSPAGYVKVGVSLGPRVRQALELSAWTKSENGDRITHGNLSVVVQAYPLAGKGLFLKGGAGFSRLVVKEAGVDESSSDAGLGVTGGLGYDIPIGGDFAISPYGSYQWGSFDGGTADHFQLGVGVTWR
jgi:hypothetical protein